MSSTFRLQEMHSVEVLIDYCAFFFSYGVQALPLCLFLHFTFTCVFAHFLCKVNQEASVLKLISFYMINFKLYLSYSLTHFVDQLLAVVQVGSARMI